nr:tripartite tricarboxylate transporter TctB family protein [Marinicella sp. W31]MDC2879278.1 tripartite tricarboxylate transporter TctB family protein [Marinicella sp. W31]
MPSDACHSIGRIRHPVSAFRGYHVDIRKNLSSGRSLCTDTDLWTGIVLTLLGAGAAWLATGFDTASRPFPLIVSLVLASCGLMIFLRALVSGKGQALPFHDFGIVALAAFLIVLWGLALKAGVGFAITTVLFLMAIFRLAGLRRPGRSLGLAVAITLVIYGIFVLVLNVHLPASFLSFIAPGF